MIMIYLVRMILMMMIMIEMKVRLVMRRPGALLECDNMRGSQNITSITLRTLPFFVFEG